MDNLQRKKDEKELEEWTRTKLSQSANYRSFSAKLGKEDAWHKISPRTQGPLSWRPFGLPSVIMQSGVHILRLDTVSTLCMLML